VTNHINMDNILKIFGRAVSLSGQAFLQSKISQGHKIKLKDYISIWYTRIY